MAAHLHTDWREQPDRGGDQSSSLGPDLDFRWDAARRASYIHAGRIRALYRSYNSRKFVVGSSTLGAVLVVAVCALLGSENYLDSAVWLSIVALADIGLTGLDRLFQNKNPQDTQLENWGWARSAASGLRALAWSLGPCLLSVPNETVTLVAPVWGIFNLLAASVYTASPFYPCLILTVFCGIAPAGTWLLLQDTSATRLAALLLVLTIPFLAFIGAIGRRNISAVIAGRLDLSEALAKQASQTEIVQAALSERTRFFSAASHDLRQPLQALEFYTSLLVTKEGDNEYRQIVGRILECTNSLNRQFHGILGIAAADAAVQRAKLAPAQLQSLFERAIVSVRPEADLKKLKLRLVPTTLWVLVNPELLERVLLNLLANAVRYTLVGDILLGARRRMSAAEIWIVDTGIGIAEQEQPKIFDEFYQVGNPSRNREFGFGLGLSTVRRLCSGLRWRLDVSSTPGKGSIFKVTVPITAAVDGEIVGPDAAQSPIAETNILILDDDLLVRDAMQRLIASWGLQVKSCRTGDEALAVLQSSDTATSWRLLVDYRLSDKENGLAFIRRARQALKQDFVAILMTAETDADIFQAAKGDQVVTLTKPIKPIRLRAVLTMSGADLGEGGLMAT